MFKTIKMAAKAAVFAGLLVVGVSAQTSGTVTLNGAVSKYVEITSGGGVTLAGNQAGTGGITTNGTLNSPLAVVVDLGELGPSNTNSFVTATVPVKLRSNAAYSMSLAATMTNTALTANRVTLADVGFGLTSISRTGTGVATGTDTNSTSGDPTLAANGSVNATSGRYEYTATKSQLNAFATASTALNGPFIMNAVPRSNANGLTANAIFAVKPQFYENGTLTVTATFTIAAL